jgi:hypothetical protein
VSFATDSVSLSIPSEVLLHCRQDLHDALAKGEIGDEVGRKHLKFLLDFYEEEEASLIKKHLDLVGQGLITYSMYAPVSRVRARSLTYLHRLWTVLKPGCTIYAPLHGQPRAFRLVRSYASHSSHCLEVEYIDYDGRRFGTTDTEVL